MQTTFFFPILFFPLHCHVPSRHVYTTRKGSNPLLAWCFRAHYHSDQSDVCSNKYYMTHLKNHISKIKVFQNTCHCFLFLFPILSQNHTLSLCIYANTYIFVVYRRSDKHTLELTQTALNYVQTWVKVFNLTISIFPHLSLSYNLHNYYDLQLIYNFS